MFHSARLTRRQLLKLGFMGAAAVAAEGLAVRGSLAEELVRGGRSVSRTTGGIRNAVPSTCAHCTARCGILGFVEDGRLVKLEGNPRDPNSRGRLCALGHAGINRLYDPDRILFPMTRAGQRGEGKWTRISWEQAYDLLEKRLQDLQSQNPESLVYHAGTEGMGLLSRRFVSAVGSKTLIDEGSILAASREAANAQSMGVTSEVADVAHARYLLNFGGNPYESHSVYLPFVQRLVDARLDGAKLITFDPRLSMTAGRSDEWFPIVPGTDGLVMLAMANVIVQQGLHNRDFLTKWTDTTPEQLGAQLAPYTPEAAEAASGVRADDIRRIATEFARVRPALAITGGGLGRRDGASDTMRAAILLNAVVGNVGEVGGYCPAPTTNFAEPDPVPPSVIDPIQSMQRLEKLLAGQGSAGLYITSMANPAYSWPNPQAFREMLLDEKRISYLVAIDTNMTETSMLADLVLPAATYLESWGLESPPAQEFVPYVTLRQPVVSAQGESLSVDDILLTMGTRLAGKSSQLFPFPTVESYLNALISKMSVLAKAGGLPLLKERGVWSDPAATAERRSRPDGFATPSRKLELGTIATAESSTDNKIGVAAPGATSANADELTLILYRPNIQSGDYSADCWWLSEITHNNALLINPVAAQRRGIKHGQRVKVISGSDSTEVPVRITEGIHPGTVALATGFGHSALGRIAQAKPFKSDDTMTQYVWWENQGNGVNANVLVSGLAADTRGGLVWKDTRVRVEAAG